MKIGGRLAKGSIPFTRSNFSLSPGFFDSQQIADKLFRAVPIVTLVCSCECSPMKAEQFGFAPLRLSLVEAKPTLRELISRYLNSLQIGVAVDCFESVPAIPYACLQESDFLLVNADQLIHAEWESLVALRAMYSDLPVAGISQYRPDDGRFADLEDAFDRVYWIATDLESLGRELLDRTDGGSMMASASGTARLFS